MNITDQVQSVVSGIQPMLRAQGRDISILEAGNERIALTLSGFCGGCDCSKDYLDGLKEMLTEQFPDVKQIDLQIA